MKSLLANRGLRVGLVILTFVSWLIVSNHCALGQLVRAATPIADHSCCQNGDSHSGQMPTGDGVPAHCCKSLHAIVNSAGWTAEPLVDASDALLAAMIWGLCTQADSELVAFAAGPPERSCSFSELVLQRSLQSHAPPVVS